MYQTILFDLDGTLTDPGLGITNSVAYALEQFGVRVEDRRTLYPFIGPPLLESFQRFYGFTLEQAEEAVLQYRVYFREKGLYENEVYPGTKRLLDALKGSGRRLVLATSKPEEFAVTILEHFGLRTYFDVITGATMDGRRSRKGDVIACALARAKVTDPDAAVMVGDREHDILGAKENGLAAVGVLFGYGSREELQAAGAAHVAETMQQLLQLLR